MRPMSPRQRTLAALGALSAAIVACAVVAAPRSCQGGLEAYFVFGIVAIVAMAGTPLALRRDLGAARRLALAVLCAAIGAAVWIGAFLAADVRLMCRLF